MTEFLLVVLLIAAVAVIAVLVLRSRRTRRPAPGRVDPLADQPDTWDPMKIGVADVITYAGIDHVVRGTITMTEGGVSWYEHLLDGSTGRRWLTVEDDEGDLELTLWQRVEGTDLVPGGDVVVNDVVHRQVERGQAAFRSEGTTGTPPTGTADYADYATRDKTGLLAFERWAPTQSWEVSTGRRVTPAELTVYHAQPGS
ncbi:hypothetical protein ASG36_17430 [Geodermatophilus sp. Leaf369]|uniref:DUF4178 domain-containing protein n=1 Tax=Geodermatophilus sp. Leaf369 TaxID=1736354 RepID=UPI0006F2B5DC|nr:DUF4178 domain-containing protein [Geodermatophilus sp. Leaf369]KQS56810.1 hypothetical protein ASG36_17430 [Geodermatophilus sp. Leaf369]